MSWETNLGVLVCRDSREGGLGKCESREHTPADTVEIISLYDVEAGMVAMHGMQDDLFHREQNIIKHHPTFGINMMFDYEREANFTAEQLN